MGLTFRVEIVILSVIVGILIGTFMLCSCSRINIVEGMEIMGASVDYVMGTDIATSWVNNAKNYASEMGSTNENKRFSNYNDVPVPLKDGQLYMFANNKFSADCCPTSYSSSEGCACISQNQINYLNERGGNRSIAPAEF